jgi:hypothetical protein
MFGVDLKGAEGTVTIDHGTKLPSDLLCLYFDPKFSRYEEFATNFVQKYRRASDPIVTPPGSTLNLKVSGDINAWAVAMLPDLQNAWNERETKREAAIQAEATRKAAIEAVRREDNEFMASLKVQGKFGRI